MLTFPLTQFHENPQVIAWWQARLHILLTWLTPFRRRLILAVGAAWVCLREVQKEMASSAYPGQGDAIGIVLVVAMLLGLSWLVYRAAIAYASLPALVRRHPQLTLHCLYWGLLVLIWLSGAASGRWRDTCLVVALLFPFLIWRFGYLLFAGQYGRMKGTRFSDHFLTLWPLYGGTNTPYGKGETYLSRCEALTEEQLARSQLAGIKLLILARLWKLALDVQQGFFYGPGNWLTEAAGGITLGIPRLGHLVAQGGADTQIVLSWASIYCELIYQVLRHAIRGHEIIGFLRLAGFNVFRNTYKPLLAESIVEFWNRYYYYFKELMANFFFLPTFTQLGGRLRNWPTFRLFAAVLAAAFIGNSYYHLIKMNEAMVDGLVFESLYELRSRIFYCLLLAIGIFVSMWREQRRAGKPPAPGRFYRILRIAGVWTFFGLIFVWNVKAGAPFMTRVEFFFSLFGIS